MTERDSNEEIEAIGLDVSGWIGKWAGEIRAQLPSEDLALFVAGEPLPRGWPPECLRIDESRDVLTVSFLHSNGEWWGDQLFVWSGFRDAGMIPAYVFTRRPLASPSALIRPIVRLIFGADLRCTKCSASAAMDYPVDPRVP